MTRTVDTARTEWVVLADGRAASLRPLGPQDRPGVQAMFSQVSAENLYTRFFGVGRTTVSRHLDHLFSRDTTVASYVVTIGSRVVGVADVEQLDHESAEVAFMVADDTHGCGVATLLLERAAGDARSHGTNWFVADVLVMNHPMLQVFTDAGFTLQTNRDGYDVTVRMSTESVPAASDASRLRSIKALRAAQQGQRGTAEGRPAASDSPRMVRISRWENEGGSTNVHRDPSVRPEGAPWTSH